ncbi:unnamed protein product [Blepharisma stoltei]|uniref:Uncharacterized protein n=1 Tax=Blepharisma stoltei TaxID=1481888 RepID=A0AAU9IG64_9CILI|nr:unnamed protein product [Blepharisma stoltei]
MLTPTTIIAYYYIQLKFITTIKEIISFLSFFAEHIRKYKIQKCLIYLSQKFHNATKFPLYTLFLLHGF